MQYPAYFKLNPFSIKFYVYNFCTRTMLLSGHWSSPGGETDLSVQLCCVHNAQLNFLHVQVYKVYKSLVVQSTNCATILDNCTAKLPYLDLFSYKVLNIFSRRFQNFLEVSMLFNQSTYKTFSKYFQNVLEVSINLQKFLVPSRSFQIECRMSNITLPKIWEGWTDTKTDRVRYNAEEVCQHIFWRLHQ